MLETIPTLDGRVSPEIESDYRKLFEDNLDTDILI